MAEVAPGERLDRPDAGLTLVETLVTLAIVAVMSGVAVLGLGAAGSGAGVEVEARRLSNTLQLAADGALVGDRTVALAWDDRGYAVVAPDGPSSQWRPEIVDLLGRRHDLPSGLALTVGTEARPAVFDAAGEGRPLSATVSGRGRTWRVAFDGVRAVASPEAAR